MRKFVSIAITAVLLCTAASCSTGAPSSVQETSTVAESTSAESVTQEAALQKAKAEELLKSMSLEEKVGQLFLINPGLLTNDTEVTVVSAELKEKAEAYHIGGWILFKPNIKTPEQIKKLISDLNSASAWPFVGVDEEGGVVSRIGSNPAMGVKKQPEMSEIGATGEPENAFRVGEELGKVLKNLGFNLDFAPVADVNTNPDNPVIGSRAFGSEPQAVAEMVAAQVRGFDSQGILSCLKHFPGHGDTSTDTHTGAASVAHDLNRLQKVELVPFRAGIDAGADMVMIGHISVPKVTGSNVPAVISPEIVTGLLRDEMGYNGVVVTDSMVMKALYDEYTLAESGVLALKAGVDILLIQIPEINESRGTPAEQFDGAYRAVISAVNSGEITEERLDESVRRILELKIKRGIFTDF